MLTRSKNAVKRTFSTSTQTDREAYSPTDDDDADDADNDDSDKPDELDINIYHHFVNDVKDDEYEDEDEDEDDDDEYSLDDTEREDYEKFVTAVLNEERDHSSMKIINNEKHYTNKDDRIVTNFVKLASFQDLAYFKELSDQDKIMYAQEHKLLYDNNDESTPLKFKILSKNIDHHIKSIIYKKVETLNNMSSSNGEYHKLQNWIHSLCKIPFGKIKDLPVKKDEGQDKIIEFMKNIKSDFDTKIYGHDEAKDQIIRIIAQWISNPTSKGNVIGIHGEPGVGKTTLIKDGLAKVLDLPFAFVPLGGAQDSSFIDGHGFTYEGSTYGKIAELLMKSDYMNPVIYFDELDKVSDTVKGQEIINVLIHLTDPGQNDNFNDKYFSEIPLDLSKALIIFTYNDDTVISPILKDRMITIKTEGYTITEKTEICKNYIIPEILTQFNIQPEEISISVQVIQDIIHNTTTEAGVRNLKRNIERLVSNVNLNVLLGKLKYPTIITEDLVETHCKKKQDTCNTVVPHMYV